MRDNLISKVKINQEHDCEAVLLDTKEELSFHLQEESEAIEEALEMESSFFMRSSRAFFLWARVFIFLLDLKTIVFIFL